jgi:hypothetical protein
MGRKDRRFIMNDKKGTIQIRSVALGIGVGLLLGIGIGILIDNYIVGLAIGFVIGLLVTGAFNRIKAPMRYSAGVSTRMAIAIILDVGVISASMLLLDVVRQPWQQYLVAALPVLPTIYLALTLGNAIGSLDELQRRIQTESISIGFAGTFVVATLLGFLGLAGLPQLNWIYVPLVMAFCWLFGKLWTMWRYR